SAMVRNSVASIGVPSFARQSERLILTPVFDPVSYDTIVFFRASARRSLRSRPFVRAMRSPAADGIKFQRSPPASIVTARSDSFSVTLFFFPAMIHVPPCPETDTEGAPHWSRVNCCADETPTKLMRTNRNCVKPFTGPFLFLNSYQFHGDERESQFLFRFYRFRFERQVVFAGRVHRYPTCL